MPSGRMGLPCLCLSTSEDHYVHMRYTHVLVAYALSLQPFSQEFAGFYWSGNFACSEQHVATLAELTIHTHIWLQAQKRSKMNDFTKQDRFGA